MTLPDLAASAVILAALLILTWTGRRLVHRLGRLRVAAAAPYWVVALGAIGISGVNSWRVAAQVLNLPGPMRLAILAVVEAGLIAAGLGLRAASLGRDRPGRHRRFLAALVGLSGAGALLVLGPLDAVIQIGVVVLGVWAWHLALGLEVAARPDRAGARTTVWARAVGELRERVLSRLGVADDARPAAVRARDRAVTRAARLALRAPRDPGARGRGAFRLWRLRRALASCGALHDPAARACVVEQLQVLRHAHELPALALVSPWGAAEDLAVRAGARPAAQPAHGDGDQVVLGERTRAELDAATLAADTPPEWLGLTKGAAVARADRLLPGRSAAALALALAAVGVEITPESVRGCRSRSRRAETI